MPVYPISVPRDYYRGSNPRRCRKRQRCNEIDELCEDYLNRKISENPNEIQMYTYALIAHELSLTTKEVSEVLFGVDAGHNGITVRKPPPRKKE